MYVCCLHSPWSKPLPFADLPEKRFFFLASCKIKRVWFQIWSGGVRGFWSPMQPECVLQLIKDVCPGKECKV